MPYFKIFLQIQLIVMLFIAEGCSKSNTSQPKGPSHGEFPNEEIRVNSEIRGYRLYVPETVNLNTPAPLVFAFHGMLIDSKDVMPVYTALNQTAKDNKFIIIYPQAIGGSWGIDINKTVKDINFFDTLLRRISSGYSIDQKKIYVLGMSNGGYFAHLIGKERSTSIAAVGSHSGVLGLQTILGINATRKFPVIIIHGDADPIFPIALAQENALKYTNEGHTVKYMQLAGKGHEWGTSIHVNDSIWSFFAKYKLP